MSMNQRSSGKGRTIHQEEASRLKERFTWLQSLTDDEWGEVVFLRDDDVMHSNDYYFDISNPERGVFKGQDGEHPPEESRYVPKSEVPEHIWHKLVGPYQ